MSVQILQVSVPTVRSLGDAALPETGATVFRACLDTITTWIARSYQRRTLRELAEERRLLGDVGLTRGQALDEAAKPFWRR